MTDVLLLNADYTPLRVLCWEKAISLLLDEKVGMVVEYADRFVRSPTTTLPWPAVVALRKYAHFRNPISFNRMHVIARDGASCQYCGAKPRSKTGRLKLEELTLDHVVPRAQSVKGKVTLPWTGKKVPVTCWENIVTACLDCNRLKADRTPAEAGMTLKVLPARPSSREAIRVSFLRAKIPDEWRLFIPEGDLINA